MGKCIYVDNSNVWIEGKYHSAVAKGMVADVYEAHDRITSTRETGEGRFDIQLFPLRKQLPGILIELKAKKNCSEDQLESLSEVALQQICDRSYDGDMKAMNITSIIKMGIAFSGKHVRISAKRETF